ncbi:hypothetical protein H4582DRAFT_2057476 [Lactarius indigo]|nr:hypothetical protein H4582DRAFT_2057476 [Lactarius indigo]
MDFPVRVTGLCKDSETLSMKPMRAVRIGERRACMSLVAGLGALTTLVGDEADKSAKRKRNRGKSHRDGPFSSVHPSMQMQTRGHTNSDDGHEIPTLPHPLKNIQLLVQAPSAATRKKHRWTRIGEDRGPPLALFDDSANDQKSFNHQLPLPVVDPKCDQGVSSDGPSGDSLPPLGFELTCYRLLNLMTICVRGVTKIVYNWTHRSQSIGVTKSRYNCGAVWSWKTGKYWEAFFQVDLAPAIGHYAKYSRRSCVASAHFCLCLRPFIQAVWVMVIAFLFEINHVERIGNRMSGTVTMWSWISRKPKAQIGIVIRVRYYIRVLPI